MRAVSIALSLAVLFPCTTGCAAERILRITSEPTGAEVRFNGTEIGETPLDFSFEHYGVVRVTLTRAGFHTSSEQLELRPPWYARFPLDIVTEILIPIGWRDRRLHHVELEPGTEVMTSPTRRSVLDRASVLRHAGQDGPRNLPERIPTEPPVIEEDPPREPGAPSGEGRR